jgi:hypothetical protein
MSEAQAPAIEVKATHVPKNTHERVSYNPPPEAPRHTEGGIRGIFSRLRQQELPKQEGPQHVLEALQELNTIERSHTARAQLEREVGAAMEAGMGDIYDAPGELQIRVDKIAAAAARRENITTIDTNEVIPIPTEIDSILKNLSRDRDNNPDDVSVLTVGKRYVQIKSRDGVNIRISLPDETKPLDALDNHMHLTIDPGRPLDENLEYQLAALNIKYNKRQGLLDLADQMVIYTENATKTLPQQNKLLQQQNIAELNEGAIRNIKRNTEVIKLETEYLEALSNGTIPEVSLDKDKPEADQRKVVFAERNSDHDPLLHATLRVSDTVDVSANISRIGESDNRLSLAILVRNGDDQSGEGHTEYIDTILPTNVIGMPGQENPSRENSQGLTSLLNYIAIMLDHGIPPDIIRTKINMLSDILPSR